MNRKKFLITASFAAFSISTIGKIIRVNDKFESSCETTNDILGPFYRPKAPIRQDLTFKGQIGSIVEIKGSVFKQDCKTPLKNALIEIWHCDTKGKYDNNSAHFHQRARWYTNEKGEYKFKTILPGKYLNGNEFRPSHIHFRVTEKESDELISQIYFNGDPHINKDPWASQKKAESRILPITLENTTGDLAVNFDIYLRKKSIEKI